MLVASFGQLHACSALSLVPLCFSALLLASPAPTTRFMPCPQSPHALDPGAPPFVFLLCMSLTSAVFVGGLGWEVGLGLAALSLSSAVLLVVCSAAAEVPWARDHPGKCPAGFAPEVMAAGGCPSRIAVFGSMSGYTASCMAATLRALLATRLGLQTRA